MTTIYDLLTSSEISVYWEQRTQDREPYLGEELFPNKKQLGMDLRWIKGSKGLPVVLKPSALDAGAVPRARIGFSSLSAEMPFFKESMYVSERLRQELNKVMATGNQAYIDAIMQNIFDDQIVLIEGAAAQRERMRMMMLTTGAISISANGQDYDYDYGIPSNHKATVTKSWSDATSDILNDIRTWQDTIEDDTGVKPTRAICRRAVWQQLLRNTSIRNTIFAQSAGLPVVSDSTLSAYLMEELDLEVVVYEKKYMSESGVATSYVPADTFVLFPAGTLGATGMGTTPEESDLMAANVANVSLVDEGVAVTTIQKADPVNVETKVTMISLPSFESADQIFIADTAV